MSTEDFLKDICPNHTDKSNWNKSELITILNKHKDSIKRKDLPCFLYEDERGIFIGYHGDTNVTEEWNDYLKLKL